MAEEKNKNKGMGEEEVKGEGRMEGIGEEKGMKCRKDGIGVKVRKMKGNGERPRKEWKLRKRKERK